MKTYNYIFKYNINGIPLSITQQGNQISGIYLSQNNPPFALKDVKFFIKETSLITMAAGQLKEYLCGDRLLFDLPIKISGTDFEKRVYDSLLSIKYGYQTTYKDIAKQIGSERAYRAVGGACGKNPLLIIVPCHRCVGQKGRLVGYSSGLELKQRLLNLEVTIAHKTR